LRRNPRGGDPPRLGMRGKNKGKGQAKQARAGGHGKKMTGRP